MPGKAMQLLLMLVAAAIASTTARPTYTAAARIQARIREQQSHKLRQLQESRPLLGLDTKNKNLRVLAFGDSITEGWINSAYTKIPWSPRVQQKLQQKLGSDWKVEVVNGGLGGAGVLDRLNDALRQHLADAQSSNQPFHYITFEAGINDLLLQNRNAPEIFDRMKELWSLANDAGSTVVVIPTLPTKVQGEREDQRRKLTALVRQYVKQQRANGNKGLFLLDLEGPFDYYNLSPERRAQIFDDGVHMTAYGYEVLGDAVYQGLVDAMGLKGSERARSAAARKPQQRRKEKSKQKRKQQKHKQPKP